MALRRTALALAALSALATVTGYVSAPSSHTLLRGARRAAVCSSAPHRVGRMPLWVRMSQVEEETAAEVAVKPQNPLLADDAVPFELFDPVTDPAELATVDMAQAKHEGPIALRHLYHTSERILIICYVKDKCSMCRVLKPIMEKVMNEYMEGGRIHYVQLEVTANKPLVYQAGLKAVPVTHIFKRGRMIRELKGLQSKKGMREKIDAVIEQYGGDEGDEALGEMDRAREESRNLKKATKRLHEEQKRIKAPRLFAPGRTLYPSRWGGLFNGVGTGRGGQAKGVVGEVFNVDALLTDEDEIDESFFKALQAKGAGPGWVRDDEGNLIKSVSTDKGGKSQDINLMGRIADGESNLDYSSNGEGNGPDMEGGEGWPQQVCDDAGCILLFGEDGAEDKSKDDSLQP